jgi:hypothetical protein
VRSVVVVINEDVDEEEDNEANNADRKAGPLDDNFVLLDFEILFK